MKFSSDMFKKDPWWVIILKIIAYAIGLIIGGIGTVDAAEIIGLIK